MLTQDELKEILFYCPITGVFYWKKVKKASRQKIGSIAGHTSKATNYTSITINGKFNAAHRLAFVYMIGAYPAECVDHINGDRSDNRWKNLRDVKRSTNDLNRSKYKTNKSGVSGVYANNESWMVRIGYKTERFYFGMYTTLDEAIKVRNEKIKLFDFTDRHGKQ
jgi:hypothetical protein